MNPSTKSSHFGALSSLETAGGTVQYYLGRELQQIGLEADAIRAHRAAAASEATAFDDEGPSIAPAARDRLADLGTR